MVVWQIISVVDFEPVNEILKCDHSNESYWAVLSCGAVYYAVQGGSNFWVCEWYPQVWLFKWKLLSSMLDKINLPSCCFRGLNQKVRSSEWRLFSSAFLLPCLFSVQNDIGIFCLILNEKLNKCHSNSARSHWRITKGGNGRKYEFRP